jgi:hypothetical protein
VSRLIRSSESFFLRAKGCGRMDETQTEREAMERMNATLKRMHASIHKPHKPFIGGGRQLKSSEKRGADDVKCKQGSSKGSKN